MVLLMVLAALISATGCSGVRPLRGYEVTGSGRSVTRDMSLFGFTTVEAAGTFQVDITRADDYSVVVTADDNLFTYLSVTTDGQALQIKLDDRYSHRLHGDAPQVKVSMPSLESLLVAGANTATGFKSDGNMAISFAGANTLTGDLEAGNLSLRMLGGGAATLTGSSKTLSVETAGGALVDLSGFVTNAASVTARGGALVRINARSDLDYDLIGGASLTYSGDPMIGKSSVIGAMAVRK